MSIKKFTMVITMILALVCTSFSGNVAVNAQTAVPFTDVPQKHWAYDQVQRLRELNITQGIGNNQFGFGKTLKRGEFVTFLVRLMGWEIVKPPQGSFTDNMNLNHNFYGSIETALLHGVIIKDCEKFRTDDPITREEISMMIVRTLGYDTLANQLNSLEKPFEDVTQNSGYITIAKDLGIVFGDGKNFSPKASATREQAAAMMIRMYDKLNTPLSELHAFYAINSASQIDKFPLLNSASFGWARLEYDEASKQVKINTDSGTNEYYIPTGYTEVLQKATAGQVSRQLMFFVKDQIVFDAVSNKSVNLAELIVSNKEVRKQVIEAMTTMVNNTEKHGSSVSFDGLVSDFEGFKGEALKLSYNAFLSELKAELSKTGKLLYVAVHPRGKPGQVYFDGYDYKTIGELADRVILMAHDYEATSLTDAEMQRGYTDTPVTPFDEVYYALKSITDPANGVKDLSKIWLQLSMDTAQWKLKDGKVINRTPYHPSYEQLRDRFLKGAVSLNYSGLSQNPYAKFDAEDGTQNIVWYENQQSITEKIKLAKMFGIKGLSLWRLGNIPNYAEAPELGLDIWREIMKHY